MGIHVAKIEFEGRSFPAGVASHVPYQSVAIPRCWNARAKDSKAWLVPCELEKPTLGKGRYILEWNGIFSAVSVMEDLDLSLCTRMFQLRRIEDGNPTGRGNAEKIFEVEQDKRTPVKVTVRSMGCWCKLTLMGKMKQEMM